LAISCGGPFDQIEENIENILISVLFIPERPSGFNDRTLSLDRGGLVFGIEFKSHVGRKYLLEQEIGLLIGNLVRE
jgi:hypothetical protein